MVAPALPQEAGWFVIAGFSIIFAIAVSLMVKAEQKYLGTKATVEWFSTAGRTVKTGLISAAVASAWTWPAGLLVSTTIAMLYGISGAFWYAAGAAVQVLLFGIIAIELKRKAPNSHTFLEIIRVRYGRGAHKVFLVFGLATNILVTAMLLLGGAATVNALTGVDIAFAAFLIPIGFMIYTLIGGLKATFIADYFNTAIIFSGVLIIVTSVYIFSPITGGVTGMFEKLTEAAQLHPVEGNAMGSYLTLASLGGLTFGIINLVGNFGTVFVDQSYWQRAIAATPASSVKGFMLGGLAWFSWPFAMAATLGLSIVALGITLTPEQASLGFAGPIAAVAVLGDLGAILVLTLIFMALTSTGCAELVAVSSLITYDIYRTYKNPNATGKQLLKLAKIVIVIFGVGMGGLAMILLKAGLSLGYVYLSMGVFISSAVVPIALSIIWKKTNGTAATIGAIVGLVAGVVVWLGTAQAMSGEITIKSTGQDFPLLWGNVTSILVGGAIAWIGSLIRPANYDWKGTRELITLVEDVGARPMASREMDEALLKKAYHYSIWAGGIMTLVLLLAWPLPMYFSGYVFDLPFYTFWAGLGVAWVLFAMAICIALPIIESRREIAQVLMRRKITPPSATAGV